MEASVNKEMVNHPSHYQTCGVETIEMMRRIWGTDAVVLFCQMNAFKYRLRAGLKGDMVEDINKALWYDNYARSISE